jgi:hypothetical protein
MWPTVNVRIAGPVAAILMLSGSATATSIVAQVDSNRILFAADTHGDKLDPGSQTSDESECKIVPLGHAALAITGNADYVRNRADDPIASWDSRSDGREAYSAHNGDLLATVADWAERGKRHYLSFYRANPPRVAQLASANSQNILLVGLFAGFLEGKATLVIEMVYLDINQLTPIRDKQLVFPARDVPYTSNGITRELIEGDSERAKASQSTWKEKNKSVPVSEQKQRRIEFVIQETAKYDRTVGTHVDILEVSPDTNQRWLQNSTCPALSQEP